MLVEAGAADSTTQVRILSAFKQGYSWLDEVVRPRAREGRRRRHRHPLPEERASRRVAPGGDADAGPVAARDLPHRRGPGPRPGHRPRPDPFRGSRDRPHLRDRGHRHARRDRSDGQLRSQVGGEAVLRPLRRLRARARHDRMAHGAKRRQDARRRAHRDRSGGVLGLLPVGRPAGDLRLRDGPARGEAARRTRGRAVLRRALRRAGDERAGAEARDRERVRLVDGRAARGRLLRHARVLRRAGAELARPRPHLPGANPPRHASQVGRLARPGPRQAHGLRDVAARGRRRVRGRAGRDRKDPAGHPEDDARATVRPPRRGEDRPAGHRAAGSPGPRRHGRGRPRQPPDLCATRGGGPHDGVRRAGRSPPCTRSRRLRASGMYASALAFPGLGSLEVWAEWTHEQDPESRRTGTLGGQRDARRPARLARPSTGGLAVRPARSSSSGTRPSRPPKGTGSSRSWPTRSTRSTSTRSGTATWARTSGRWT